MKIFIIAELCQNHLGNYELLEKMVDKAVDSGATHIKIQHIHTKNLTLRPQFENGLIQKERTMAIKRPWASECERLKKLELNYNQYYRFVQLVKSKGAIPVTTCFAREDIPLIKDQGFKTVKVASYDCASYQMLRELASNFAQLIISTGATYDEEIKKAAEVLENYHNYCFLHCVTIYPTPLNQIHLSRMNYLKKYSSKVGFSDHSLVSKDELWASKAALALGAEIIERHFTILGAEKSKDGPVSVKPEHIKELARFIKLDNETQKKELQSSYPDLLNIAWGSPKRDLSEEELLNRDYYRGRFASPRKQGVHSASQMIFNWEETPL